LALALSGLPLIPDDRVLVGHTTADDAGVFRLSNDRALVQTVDVLAPIVDDPYTYGKIAAVNSLSDIYAMGGDPLTALSVLGYPSGGDVSVMTDIIRGAQDAVVEAGAALLGGHTFSSDEIRFGLSITGEIHPDRIFTNSGAKIGDLLILTKPLGVGLVTSALAQRGALPDGILTPAIVSMLTSNRVASEIMRQFDVHACTDVTGFGLLGHAWEMAAASGVGIQLDASSIPLLSGVRELWHKGVRDGAANRNKSSFKESVRFEEGVGEELQDLLFSSETSGGLLMAIPGVYANLLLTKFRAVGIDARQIGQTTSETGILSVNIL